MRGTSSFIANLSLLCLVTNSVTAIVPLVALNRTGWTVTADSYQSTYPPSNVLDGNNETIWWTEYSPVNASLPHNITINMQQAQNISGLTYLPRQDYSANGNIGQHSILVSTDGKNFTMVASGTWTNDDTLKTTSFSSVEAQYVMLAAQSEAQGQGYTWSSAAELNILTGPPPPGAYRVFVDSQEVTAANHSGYMAIDENTQTFWQTAYTADPAPGFPHQAILDLSSPFGVNSLTYTPRQDGNSDGNIGNFTIAVSMDNATWTTVATGGFIDDATTKIVNFGETVAQYVRLMALSEAGNRGPWTSAAELSVNFTANYTLPNTNLGQWGTTIDFPIVPVAGALLNTGNLVVWSAFAPTTFGFGGFEGYTQTAIYYPSTGEVDQRSVTNTDHDMFCPGISIDFNGRPVVTGGNDAERDSIYDVEAGEWIWAMDMQIERGYQAQCTLSDGNIFIIGGSWNGGVGNKNGELYIPTTNQSVLLPGCPVAPMLTDDAQGVYRADNHGWLFAWKNSTVFQAGPSKHMNWYGTLGNGTQTPAGLRADDTDAMTGDAVMYDAVNGKILATGGSPDYQDSNATPNAHVITIGEPFVNATVETIGSMHFARAFANGIVLPDGKVFITGGQTYAVPFTDTNSILYPELWDPVTQEFTVMNPHAVPRNYHSIGLLLPDATVFNGGGGLCGDCTTNHLDAEIFSPPYLFNENGSRATRPVISSVSSSVVLVGGTFSATTDGSGYTFSLIRQGSATHTVDTDQRRIALGPRATLGKTYTFTLPSDPGIVIPGYWMLFALNSQGTPSIATTIQVVPTTGGLKLPGLSGGH